MFAIDFYRLLRDFCLFILGIYGADMSENVTKIVDNLERQQSKKSEKYNNINKQKMGGEAR